MAGILEDIPELVARHSLFQKPYLFKIKNTVTQDDGCLPPSHGTFWGKDGLEMLCWGLGLASALS